METKDIIVFALGLVTGLSINMITHIYAKVRDNKNNFLRLSDDLRKPFIEAMNLFDLHTAGIPDMTVIDSVLNRLYTEQSKSIQVIMPHIPARQRKRLDATWNEYQKYTNEEKPSSWFGYQNLYKTDDKTTQQRKACTVRLDNILFFFDYHNMFSVFRAFKRLQRGRTT
jgi:hypothetical protein